MAAPAIVIEDLGKRYRLGRLHYGRLTESISNTSKRLLKSKTAQNGATSKVEYLWALRHVDLEIAEGEVMGIIGHNGAGKTTLLKVLSRITEPTEGRARFVGVVGSRRSEVKRKFDEIVGFAEIGRFLDTPVKRYSSGMYVRLAFSVAAHLEPDILVVDEVLAVGDVEFQKRCIGKMDDVARTGRTVLFVSHNMAAIGRLCRRAVWFEKGHIVEIGSADRVVENYLTSSADFQGERVWPEGAREPGVTELSVRRARIVTPRGVTGSVDMRDGFSIEIDYDIHQAIRGMVVIGLLRRADGVSVFESSDADVAEWPERRLPGSYRTGCAVPSNLLNEGRYTFTIYFLIPDVRFFAQIQDGVIRPELVWTQSSET